MLTSDPQDISLDPIRAASHMPPQLHKRDPQQDRAGRSSLVVVLKAANKVSLANSTPRYAAAHILQPRSHSL